MPTTYTSLIGLALPATGELSGTWGDTVNNYISNYIDAAVAGAQTVTTDTTLTKTTGSSLGSTSSQYAIIIASPASANITITAPAASKIYTIINTSGTYTVTIRGAGPTTGVTLGVNEKAQVAWNGSDFVKIGAPLSTPYTANGVVYASSSSALTTGSALTFDGTNLGIGTSSPGYKLTVNGRISYNGAIGEGADTTVSSSSTSLQWGNSATWTAHFWYTGGTEKMRLDSSGNLGLGVTPSAWSGASAKAFETAGGSIANFGTGQFVSVANAYYNSGWLYKNSGLFATEYQQASGQHVWYNAPSGTAGNAITFTQAMTLDASGRLLVNGTSATSGLASGTLQVGSGFAVIVNTGSLVAPTILTSGSLEFNFDGVSGTQRHGRITGNGSTVGGAYAGGLTFEYYAYDGSSTYQWYTGLSMDSGGNVNVSRGFLSLMNSLGYNSSSNKTFYMGADNDTSVNNGTPYNWQFFVAGDATGQTLRICNAIRGGSSQNEVARFDAGGKFVVGNATATTALLGAFNSANIPMIAAFSSATSGYTDALLLAEFRSYAPNNGTARFSYFGDNVAARAVFYSNGGLANFSANNSNLSDRREKTNFAPAKSYLETICAIPVQTFNYIDQNMEDDPGLTLGVVAQDVQAVAPELVSESNWGTEDNPKMRLSIYQTDLQYALMKCIQEQQAIIQSLTNRIAQLEAK